MSEITIHRELEFVEAKLKDDIARSAKCQNLSKKLRTQVGTIGFKTAVLNARVMKPDEAEFYGEKTEKASLVSSDDMDDSFSEISFTPHIFSGKGYRKPKSDTIKEIVDEYQREVDRASDIIADATRKMKKKLKRRLSKD